MIVSIHSKSLVVRHACQGCLAAVLAVLLGISWDMAICGAEPPDKDAPGTEVLTRGPVHEAFAGVVTFNPEPGVVAPKVPPDVIEELPPDEKPEGDNVTWIPGYWAWDDERTDFLWVSGTWRALPPGRAWMAGYWAKTPQGYQWTSGYWADAAAKETTYLPTPPATMEVGPNIAAPSPDYGWTPGCWIWFQGRYAWRPGYWVAGRADWDWMPPHYVWTPRGFIFVGGFWDFPVQRRGIIFAPVYFGAGFYSRRGYYYSPRIVIDMGVFTDHLFLRPHYHHYYFGDYYAASYHQGGFYASFSFQSSHYGYDPIYAHLRWEHRRDRDWAPRVEASYQYRRDHEAARPPRTWAAQRTIDPGRAEFQQNHMQMATPIDQMAKRKDNPVRFQPVAKEERQTMAQRTQDVQKSRDQRRTLEAKAVEPAARKPGAAPQPAQVKLPRSPIVAKSASASRSDSTPPQAPRAPKPDLKLEPKSDTSGRAPNVIRSNPQPQPQPRPAELERKPAPGRNEAVPRKIQPEAQPRPVEAEKKPAPGRSEAAPRQVQPEAKPRPAEAPKPTPGETPKNVRGSGTPAPAPPVSRPPAREKPSSGERGATKLMENSRQKQDQGKPAPTKKPPVP